MVTTDNRRQTPAYEGKLREGGWRGVQGGGSPPYNRLEIEEKKERQTDHSVCQVSFCNSILSRGYFVKNITNSYVGTGVGMSH